MILCYIMKNKPTLLVFSACLNVAVLALLAMSAQGVLAATNCSGGTCYYVACNTNADCGSSQYVTGSESCQQCVGISLYLFDSNGNQQGVSKACGSNQTCSVNRCVAAQQSCTPHATKGCFNNSVYWYDSCGTQETAYQNCALTGKACQEG